MLLRRAARAVADDLAPDGVAVALDDGGGAAELVGFLGIERGVDAAEDHRGAGRLGGAADLVAAQRVAGVDADADDVTRLDRREVERLERFVGDDAGRRTPAGVAAAMTNSQRGVMTPTPNETWLGLTR